MIVVVVDSAAQFHRSLRRKVAGLSQWERMRRTLRRAGADRIYLATNDRPPPPSKTAPVEVIELSRLPDTSSPVDVPKEVVSRLENETGPFLVIPLSFLTLPSSLSAFIAAGRAETARPLFWPDGPIFTPTLPLISRRPPSPWPARNHWSASVRDDTEARTAEDRLFRLVLKGKEERLGRWNRAISRPITRWLLPHPVSPNAVTLAGLLVSLGAGYFLALGSDRSLIAGTLLMVLSTALDSTDGMIARLKMEESQLGCWLETVTDYLFYLICFGGLAIGMARQGKTASLLLGIALLCGAGLTCAIFLYLRRLLSRDGRADTFKFKLLELIQQSPPLLRTFMEKSYPLMIRPYVSFFLLGAAVIHVPRLFLLVYAVGAQVSWMFGVYLAFLIRSRARGLT